MHYIPLEPLLPPHRDNQPCGSWLPHHPLSPTGCFHDCPVRKEECTDACFSPDLVLLMKTLRICAYSLVHLSEGGGCRATSLLHRITLHRSAIPVSFLFTGSTCILWHGGVLIFLFVFWLVTSLISALNCFCKFWKSDILNRSLYHFNWEIPSDILKDCVICHWVQLHCIPLFLCGRFFMVIQISHDFLDFASQNCKMGCWD